jgi:hypothetical protein
LWQDKTNVAQRELEGKTVQHALPQQAMQSKTQAQ